MPVVTRRKHPVACSFIIHWREIDLSAAINGRSTNAAHIFNLTSSGVTDLWYNNTSDNWGGGAFILRMLTLEFFKWCHSFCLAYLLHLLFLVRRDFGLLLKKPRCSTLRLFDLGDPVPASHSNSIGEGTRFPTRYPKSNSLFCIDAEDNWVGRSD